MRMNKTGMRKENEAKKKTIRVDSAELDLFHYNSGRNIAPIFADKLILSVILFPNS